MGSAANGSYLGMLELLAQYYDFLKQHIHKHANLGSGHTNYFSSTICEELVQLMGKRVLDEIVSRIKRSRYYSVTLDSTPDEGHVDQLTLVFRFMENTTPVERFVTFMPNQGHKAEDMFDGLMQFIDTHGIDIHTTLSRPVLRQCISHEWKVQWPSSQGSNKEQPGGLDTLCRALAKPSC